MEIHVGLKIKNLPHLERPREKAIRYGFNTLSDAEILAIIISSGTRDISAIDLSNIVISKFGGLYNTVNKSFSDFVSFKGIKVATAAKLCAIFEIAKRYNSKRINYENNSRIITSETIYKMYVNSFTGLDQETLVLLVLNKARKIVYECPLYLGNENSVKIEIRDILKMVLSHNGYYFYVIHNHPSGSLSPSAEDERFTMELVKACKEVGILMLDHLIISKKGYYSFLLKDVKEETNENNDWTVL